MPIHSISRCYNTLYTSNIDVGCSQWDLQPQPWHRNIIQARRAQPYHISPKFTPTWTRITAIMMHPYAHPQHLKVLRLFVYIRYGCGMQSMGVFSVNHDTATSYRAGKLALHGQNGGRSINNHWIPLWSHCLFFSWISVYEHFKSWVYIKSLLFYQSNNSESNVSHQSSHEQNMQNSLLMHPTGHFRINFFHKHWDLSYQHIYLGHPLKLKGVWANIILGDFTGATPTTQAAMPAPPLLPLLKQIQQWQQHGMAACGGLR